MNKRTSAAARAPRRAAEASVAVPAVQQSTDTAQAPVNDAVAALLLDVLRKASSGIVVTNPPASNGPLQTALNQFLEVASQLATLADPPALRRPL
jgi:hypothetical protein